MIERIRKALPWLMLLVAVGAVIQELNQPAEERTWHGRFLGIPYDFRFPTLQRLLDAWWNPNDERLITPRAFGVGWAINLYQVRRQIKMLMA